MGFARGLEMDMSQCGYSPVFSLIVLFGGSVRERASPCAWWLGENETRLEGGTLIVRQLLFFAFSEPQQ